MIAVVCSSCQRAFSLPNRAPVAQKKGSRALCPSCKRYVVIPDGVYEMRAEGDRIIAALPPEASAALKEVVAELRPGTTPVQIAEKIAAVSPDLAENVKKWADALGASITTMSLLSAWLLGMLAMMCGIPAASTAPKAATWKAKRL
jgi:hypothetical protein